MTSSQDNLLSLKRIDQNSEPGKALQKVVQVKLKDFLGQDYADDVLPLYIVVMLAHGNQADLVADNLEAFLGQPHAQQFVQWLFQHLTEAGEKYAAPDHEDSRSTASSLDGSSVGKMSSEDGGASAMVVDEAPQLSTMEVQPAEATVEHINHVVERGDSTHSQETRYGAKRDRQSKGSPDRDRHADPPRSRQSPRQRPEPHLREEVNRRSKQANGQHHVTQQREESERRHAHSDRYGRHDSDIREAPGDWRHERQQYSSQGYTSSRHRNPARDYRQESTLYGDRSSRDGPRGYLRNRREGDIRGEYSQTDREPKRRRSDPVRVEYTNGHQAERDDRGYRPQSSRMRSDAILAKQSAEQRLDQQHEPAMVSEPAMPRGPSVRSVVQRVSSADDEEDDRPDRRAAARSHGSQHVRLFETAMRQVAAPTQPNRPSVFDRLTIQAAKGNNAAAVTASAVVRRLQRSAAAAAAGKKGPDSNSVLALKEQLQVMEQEVRKLRRQQQAVLGNVASLPVTEAVATPAGLAESSSVVVHNVHYSATPQIVAAHFSGCGPATRVTILKDGITGRLTGTAYVQFLTSMQAAAAVTLTGSAMLQRPITVSPKPFQPAYKPSMQYPSSRGDALYSSLSIHHLPQYSGPQYSGKGGSTPRGRGRGRRGAPYVSTGGAKGGRGSEQSKSNVYIRPGLQQQ